MRISHVFFNEKRKNPHECGLGLGWWWGAVCIGRISIAFVRELFELGEPFLEIMALGTISKGAPHAALPADERHT